MINSREGRCSHLLRWRGRQPCLGCGLWVRLGVATVVGTQVGNCNGRRGYGRWPTGPRMGACPPAAQLPVLTAGRSGGAV
jgi:hypothetical protein